MYVTSAHPLVYDILLVKLYHHKIWLHTFFMHFSVDMNYVLHTASTNTTPVFRCGAGVWASLSSGGQLVHGNTQVPQLLVLGIVGYLFSRESYCYVSAQVFSYLVEVCETWISAAVGPPDLALIDDINFSWFILWYAETMSLELELALSNRL